VRGGPVSGSQGVSLLGLLNKHSAGLEKLAARAGKLAETYLRAVEEEASRLGGYTIL
jgi:hypothetical protein